MRIYRALYSPKALAGLCYRLGVLDKGEFKWGEPVSDFRGLKSLISMELSRLRGYVSIRNGEHKGGRRLVPEEFDDLKGMQTAHNKKHSQLLRASEGRRELARRENELREAEGQFDGLRNWRGTGSA